MTKNDYFYSFMDKCGKKLGEKRFKKFKLELIDVFQEKWDKYINSKNPDAIVDYAIKRISKTKE